MTTLASKEAQRGFSELVGRVRFGRERVIVTYRGKPAAAMVPIADLAKLEAKEAPEA